MSATLTRTRPSAASPPTASSSRLPRRRPVPHTAKVVVALLTVYAVWGSTFLALGVAVTTVPPFLLLAARFALAGGALYLVALRRVERPPTWREWRAAFVTGQVLLVGGTGLVAAAQVDLPSGTVALLCATVPLWLAVLARVRHGERLHPRAWVGLALGLAGIAGLVDPSGGRLGPTLLALAGAAAWATGTLRSRSSGGPRHALLAAAMEMLGAAVGFAVVAVALGEPGRFEPAAVTGGTAAAFAYLVTAGSLVAFSAYGWLLRNASTVLVGSHAYVNPVVAVTLGWAFAAELVTARTLTGGAVVLCAVVLLVTGRPEQPVPAQATSGGDVFAGDEAGPEPGPPGVVDRARSWTMRPEPEATPVTDPSGARRSWSRRTR